MDDQREIVDLMSIESDVDIYELNDNLKSVSIWIETYEGGILISEKD